LRPVAIPEFKLKEQNRRHGCQPVASSAVDAGHLGHVDDLHDAARYLFLDENLATSPAAVNPFNARVGEGRQQQTYTALKKKFPRNWPKSCQLWRIPPAVNDYLGKEVPDIYEDIRYTNTTNRT
jgi:hypothetical protein